MDKRDVKDAAEHARLLAEDLEDIVLGHARGSDFARWVASAEQNLAQVAMSMGYTITPRKPLPSITTTAGDV